MKNKTSPIRVGAGKAEISFPKDFFPYVGFNHRILTGIHDDLFVRAVRIENDSESVLFVSVDTGDLSGDWLPEISELSGIEDDHIFLMATHTHEAPYIDSSFPEQVGDEEKTELFIKQFRKALAKAVKEAEKSMCPARIGFGIGECSVNVNRDLRESNGSYVTGVNPHGPTDHTVAVWKAETLDGEPIAILTNYAVHSSVMLMYNRGMKVSSDLAGEAMRYVEEKTGAVSLFSMGAAADQDPLFSSFRLMKRLRRKSDSGQPSVKADDMGESFILVIALGGLLGNEIVSTADKIEETVSMADIAAVCGIVTASGQKKPELMRGEAVPENFIYEDAENTDLRIGMIKIADTVFAGVSGEIMNSIGRDIQNKLHEKHCKNVVVMTQCNGSWSYMGDDEAYDSHKFAAMASHMQKGIAGLLTEGFSNLSAKLK